MGVRYYRIELVWIITRTRLRIGRELEPTHAEPHQPKADGTNIRRLELEFSRIAKTHRPHGPALAVRLYVIHRALGYAILYIRLELEVGRRTFTSVPSAHRMA